MKTWLFAIVASFVGAGIGVGITLVERFVEDEAFLPEDFRAREVRAKETKRREIQSSQSWPKVEYVNGRVHEFGSMERSSKRSHTFLVKNAGNAPLTLEITRTTCKCTISALNGESFMPGETGEITVEWTGQTLSRDPDFKQGIEIVTNDPENEMISLVISGYVTESIRTLPAKITLGKVSSNDGGQGEFRLFGFLSDEIEILESGFDEADTADLYKVDFEPLPKEEYEKEKGAKCGLLGKLTVKSGLPLGPINQTIRLRTRVEKEATIYIPVEGQVESDIMIARSSRFDPTRNRLNFGPLKPGQSAKEVLQFFIRGDHRTETKLSAGKIDPAEYINVDVGPPEELNNGKTIRYMVTIEIPSGLKRINRLGSEFAKHGSVVIETTHPTTKQVPIRVRFAVD